MSTIRIADLTIRLSEHLRTGPSGRSLTVLDRDTLIARLVPHEDSGAAGTMRGPLPTAPRLPDVPLPPPLRVQKDIVKLLLEERQVPHGPCRGWTTTRIGELFREFPDEVAELGKDEALHGEADRVL